MEVEHHLASYQKAKKQKNIDAVRDFFSKNPYSNMTDCAKRLGISRQTVMRSVSELKKKS